MLSVVDSLGAGGGQPSISITVVGSSGSTTSCIPPQSSTVLTITPNFTSPVTTCQFLGMQMSGGKKPYNLTLSALYSILINITLGPADDVFTYVDRKDPDTQFLVSACDADGVWAKSTQLFQTTSSTDTSCPGLVSSACRSIPPKGHSNATVPIAVFLVIALVLLTAGFYFWRRKEPDASAKLAQSSSTTCGSALPPRQAHIQKHWRSTQTTIRTPHAARSWLLPRPDIETRTKAGRPSPSCCASNQPPSHQTS